MRTFSGGGVTISVPDDLADAFVVKHWDERMQAAWELIPADRRRELTLDVFFNSVNGDRFQRVFNIAVRRVLAAAAE